MFRRRLNRRIDALDTALRVLGHAADDADLPDPMSWDTDDSAPEHAQGFAEGWNACLADIKQDRRRSRMFRPL